MPEKGANRSGVQSLAAEGFQGAWNSRFGKAGRSKNALVECSGMDLICLHKL